MWNFICVLFLVQNRFNVPRLLKKNSRKIVEDLLQFSCFLHVLARSHNWFISSKKATLHLGCGLICSCNSFFFLMKKMFILLLTHTFHTDFFFFCLKSVGSASNSYPEEGMIYSIYEESVMGRVAKYRKFIYQTANGS